MMRKTRWRSVCVLAGLVLCCGGIEAAWAGELRAGAAKISITSTPDEFPYQVLRELPFVGVHDNIFARALVLDDGQRRVVLVSVETTAVPFPEQVVKAVAGAANVPVSNVMVAASHTHVVPLVFYHGHDITPTQQREIDRLQQGAVQATRDAVAHLQPARIAAGRGEAFVNINNGEEANLKSWANPLGSSDKTLDLVRVNGADGSPIALLVNYATHGEVMFRSVTKNGGYEETGDLPGAASRILEGQTAAAPVVLFTSAAEGDQLPLFKSLQPDAELPGADEGAGGWGVLDLLARRLSASVITTLGGMKPGVSEVRIGAVSGSVSCPGQHYQRDSNGKVTSTDTAPVSIPLSVIRINDIALAGVGADLASNIGKAIKSASPVKQTSVVTMIAGSVGYVLNDASYVQPGHGAMGSPVKPGCAQRALSDGVARLLTSAGK
jgi:hypothetical protein